MINKKTQQAQPAGFFATNFITRFYQKAAELIKD
jgi:hypothetical protein